MRNSKFLSIILSAALLFIPLFANAVVADPKPKTITQPDGSTLTITVHGDEFLHWTTVGNRLVEKGADGFYYLATFNEDGTKTISSTRATNSSIIPTSTPVRPPFAAAQMARLKRAQRNNIQRSSSISLGNKNFLVLLIEFSDLPFTVDNPQQAFSNLLNQEGYNKNGATGSSKDYYYENSSGAFDPSFDVYGPIKVSGGYAEYGSNDAYGFEPTDYLLAEACRLADKDIDFSDYDLDSDGRVDNVFFFFAGHNEAEGGGSDRIWPHAWAIYRDQVYLDGVQVFQFACTSEYNGYAGQDMANIGTFTHEFAHVIGLPDFYDTNYEEDGYGNGLSNLSLMSGGSYNNNNCTPPYLNGIERNMLGWMDEFVQLSTSGEKTIEPIFNNVSYITLTDNPGEFYMYESRPAVGWDKYIGASGLAIYHVDQSKNMVNGNYADRLWQGGYDINSYAAHQCFDLIESVPTENDIWGPEDLFFPGGSGRRTFDATSTPAAITWAGHPTGYNISKITISGDNVTFDLKVDHERKIEGRIVGKDGAAIPNANITITPLKSESSAISRLGVLNRASQEVITTRSNMNGEYSVNISDFDEYTMFQIKIQLLGYMDYTNVVEVIAGTFLHNVTLLTYSESMDIELKKHNELNNSLGSGDPSVDWWAAVSFSADELSAYSSYMFRYISFVIMGDSVDEVGVVLYRGDERIYIAEVPTEDINLGTTTTVAINENIEILPGYEYRFGYYTKGCDPGYPLAIDAGPRNEGGSFFSNDGDNWYSLADADIDANFIISAVISQSYTEFEGLGINLIVSPKNIYSAGESFTFALTKSIKEIAETQWYFDNNLQSEESIVLTSGEHTIKAVVTYSDGSSDILVQEIMVE